MEEVKYLIFTILIELPVAAVVTGGKEWRWVLFATVCVNFITHPIAWYAVSSGASWTAVEGAVIVAEAVMLAWFFPKTRARAALAACAMNVVSALVGRIL